MATPKPRDCFHDTIVYADSSGIVHALAGIKVVVYYANSDQLADIYPDYDTMDVRKNPVETSQSGQVFFYADVGEYDVSVEDPQQRITNTRFRWNATNSSPGGLPLFALAEDIRRQLAQVGQVIDWWRPAPTVPLPSGWEICDGRTVPANAHDFGTGAALVLPDLRNAFILGADVQKADGVASANGNGSAASGTQHPYAPGIGGTGGSNAAKDLRHTHVFSHTHTIPDHTHNATAPDHLHGAGAIYTNSHGHNPGTMFVSGHTRSTQKYQFDETGAVEALAYANSNSLVSGATAASGNLATGGLTAAADRALTFVTANMNEGRTTSDALVTTTDNGTLTNPGGTSVPQDFRPAHVGLLKLMKVRRA